MKTKKKFALILGGSGSFGLASAKLLAIKGFNLILIFRESKFNVSNINLEIESLKKKCNVIQFNLNANVEENQNYIVNFLSNCENVKNNISFMLHSISDGNLKPLFSNQIDANQMLKTDDFSHTIHSMGTSLYHWTNLLFINGLFANKTSIVGMSSEGANRYFSNYAAISAAKSVLESNIRYIAIDLAKYGIRANIVNAGIADTNALKKFPNYDSFIEKAKLRNPFNRLTSPDDVAKVIAFLASEDSSWINGSIITVDGGEQLKSIL